MKEQIRKIEIASDRTAIGTIVRIDGRLVGKVKSISLDCDGKGKIECTVEFDEELYRTQLQQTVNLECGRYNNVFEMLRRW